MSITRAAEIAGRTFGKTRLGVWLRSARPIETLRRVPLKVWVLSILLVGNTVGLAFFFWMFRFQIGGNSLILDRLTHTVFQCGFSSTPPYGSSCSQLYPATLVARTK